jgi:LmbE family N-acetylglucosaminyl deacetylase
MIRRLAILWLVAVASPGWGQQKFPPVTHDDRILIVAPHPDDEILGTGGLIQQALAVGADVRVVYLTYGDHNQIAFKLYHGKVFMRPSQYLACGAERRREAITATGLLGLPADHLTFLGYPDWWTLRIWRDAWGTNRVVRSDATRVTSVPYRDAYRFGAPYRGPSIAGDLAEFFRKYQPTKIFVTHPADSNPDHRAAANFVRLAALETSGEGRPPPIYYFVIHFGHWSQPFHYHPELELRTPKALLDNGDWMSSPLTSAQTETKYNAILANRTQTSVGEYFLVSFARANELFATMPVVTIPQLPADWELNWRNAVRNKAIPVPPFPTEQLPGPAAAPAEALDLEQTEFLIQGEELIAQITLKNRLGKRTGVHLFLFGYRNGTDFARLPKVDVDIKPLGGQAVLIDGRRVPEDGIRFESVENRLFVRVPLRLLGAEWPDYIFTATRAHWGEIAPDDTAWQLFAVPPRKAITHD